MLIAHKNLESEFDVTPVTRDQSLMFRKAEIGENIDSLLSLKTSKLPPEVEEGNIEYKLKLVETPPERIEHLTTQLKWRLAEGNGEAMYEIGVSDSGNLVGLNKKEMDASLKTLREMGSNIMAEMFILRTRQVDGDRSCAEILFRTCEHNDFVEIRVTILGAADAGKSTLLGLLCYGEKDNGHGKARLNLLRHPHEIESGRTSSLARQIIGFGSSGQIINYASTNVSTWEQICESAAKVVTFIDVPGHAKYQKTTIGGLTGNEPDYACLILSASFGGLPDVSRDQIWLTKMLKVPLLIFITKIDIATQSQLAGTIGELMKVLKSPGVNRIPIVMQNEDDLSSSLIAITTRYILLISQIVPLFLTSSVTGENSELLINLFNRLPKSTINVDLKLEEDMVFQVQDHFSVDGVCVLGGTAHSGRIYISGNIPQLCYLGPDQGKFIPVIVYSIHRQRCHVKNLQAGQAGTCAIKFRKQSDQQIQLLNLLDQSSWQETIPNSFKVRRGQVLVSTSTEPDSFWEFDVELFVLSDRLFVSQEVKIHCKCINQSAKVMNIVSDSKPSSPTSPTSPTSPIVAQDIKPLDSIAELIPVLHKKSKKRKYSSGVCLSAGKNALVTFRFCNEPEFIILDSTVVIRDQVKCVGKLTSRNMPNKPSTVSK